MCRWESHSKYSVRQSSPIPPKSQIIRLSSDFWQRHVMPESKRVTFTNYSRKEKCNWRILDSAKLTFNYKRRIEITYKHAKLQGVLYPWAFLRNGLEHEFMATRKIGRNYGMSVLLWRKEIGKSMMEILLYAWSQYKSILHTFNYQELCHMVSIFCKRERPCVQFQFYCFGKNGNKYCMTSQSAQPHRICQFSFQSCPCLLRMFGDWLQERLAVHYLCEFNIWAFIIWSIWQIMSIIKM